MNVSDYLLFLPILLIFIFLLLVIFLFRLLSSSSSLLSPPLLRFLSPPPLLLLLLLLYANLPSFPQKHDPNTMPWSGSRESSSAKPIRPSLSGARQGAEDASSLTWQPRTSTITYLSEQIRRKVTWRLIVTWLLWCVSGRVYKCCL